mgnify:CR=1 FL=1
MAIAELFQGLKPVADAPAAPDAGKPARPPAAEKSIKESPGDGGGNHSAALGVTSAVTSYSPNADAAGDMDVVDDGDWAERAANVEYQVGAPREWAEGLATLEVSAPPAQFTPAEWRQVIHDAGVFVDDWGRQAAALGWTAYDIFGCNRRAPRARLDALGLVALLRGGRVVALTADTATIRTPTGALQTYRRRADVEARDGLLWEICHSE